MKCVIILGLSLIVTVTSQVEVQQNETQIPDGEIDKNDQNKTGDLRMANIVNELHRQEPAVSIKTPQLCQNIDVLSKIWTLLSNYISKQDRSYVLVQEIDKIQSVLELVRRYLGETPGDVRNLALIEKVNNLVAELEIQKTLKPVTPYPNNGIWHNFLPTVPKRTINPSCKEALANLIKSVYTAYIEIIRNPLCDGDTLINPMASNYLPNQNVFENLDILLPDKGTSYPTGGLNYLLQYLLNKEENQYPSNIFPMNQGRIPINHSLLPSGIPNINLDLITSMYPQRYPTMGHNINVNTGRPKQDLLNPNSDQLILDYIIQQNKIQPIDKIRGVNPRDLIISQLEKLIQNNPGQRGSTSNLEIVNDYVNPIPNISGLIQNNPGQRGSTYNSNLEIVNDYVNPIPNISGQNIGGKTNNIYYKKYINGIPLNNNENGISSDINNGGIISGIVDSGNQNFVNGWNKIQYQDNVNNPNLIGISENLSPEPYNNLITHQLGNSRVVNPGLLDYGLNKIQYVNKPKINPFPINEKGVYGSSRPDNQKEVLTSKIISPYNGQQVLLGTAAGGVNDKKINSLQGDNVADLQSEGVTDRIQWYSSPDKSQVIELTYLLKQPKSIVYQPLSYVTYRMPYNKLVYKINDIIAKKPDLRSDPNKLYSAIIKESNITELSPDLKIYDKSEITNLLLRNGTLIKARVVSNDNNLNAQDLQKLYLNPNDLKNNTTYLYNLIKSIDSLNNGKGQKVDGDDDGSSSQVETINFLETNKPVESFSVITSKPVVPLSVPYNDLLNSYTAASYQLNPMPIQRIIPGALKRRLTYGTINPSNLDTNDIIKPTITDQDKTRQRNIQAANPVLLGYNHQVNSMGYSNLQPNIVPANAYSGSNQLSNQILPAVLASQQSVNSLYPTGYPGFQPTNIGKR